jgi:hypothetical protein
MREQLALVENTKATATVGTTLGQWLVKHREDISKPLIDSRIKTENVVPGTKKVSMSKYL